MYTDPTPPKRESALLPRLAAVLWLGLGVSTALAQEEAAPADPFQLYGESEKLNYKEEPAQNLDRAISGQAPAPTPESTPAQPLPKLETLLPEDIRPVPERNAVSQPNHRNWEGPLIPLSPLRKLKRGGTSNRP
jgi:hypothetical protein